MDNSDRVRFGLFEFDLDSGQLWREGVLVHLQAQPARVLGELIRRPNAVVTRDDLRSAVWGAETFVDFDRGLNFCIAQIRAALGDSAESPRFVRTFPKRGYQFIAPVERVTTVSDRRFRARAAGSAVLIVLSAALLLIGGRFWILRRASVQPPSRLAVVRFDNETDSSEFDRFADGLTDALVAELTRANAGRYGVIGNAAILREPRARRDLGAIAASLRVSYVVLGQVQRSGSHIRVLAHLVRVPDQTHLWVSRFDRTVDDPLRIQTELAQRIATEFAQRLAREREPPPIVSMIGFIPSTPSYR